MLRSFGFCAKREAHPGTTGDPLLNTALLPGCGPGWTKGAASSPDLSWRIANASGEREGWVKVGQVADAAAALDFVLQRGGKFFHIFKKDYVLPWRPLLRRAIRRLLSSSAPYGSHVGTGKCNISVSEGEGISEC